jgi:hypothetical protein
MNLSKEDVLKLVNELSNKDAKVAFYLKRVGGDFNKLPQIRQIGILHKLGMKREIISTQTFKNKEGKRISEEDFMLFVQSLAEVNGLVASHLEVAVDYFDIPLHVRKEIENELNIHATQVKSIKYKR